MMRYLPIVLLFLASQALGQAAPTWGPFITPTALAGDCGSSISGTTVNMTCTKTNGVAFAPSATTDTTNAANILSGTLPSARLPNPLVVGSITFSGGSAPTIAAGAGAGTSPTISVTGNLNSQIISLTTTCTVTCTGSSIIATVTLPVACTAQVVANLTAGNINVAQLSGSGSVYITEPTLQTYVLNSSSTGLVASTAYKWNIHVDCW
jgi:hypothetical protein